MFIIYRRSLKVRPRCNSRRRKFCQSQNLYQSPILYTIHRFAAKGVVRDAAHFAFSVILRAKEHAQVIQMTSTGTVRLLPRVRIVWLFPKAEQFPKRNLISKAVRVKCFLEKWMTFDKATLLLLKSNVNARKHTRARNRKQTLLLMSSSGTSKSVCVWNLRHHRHTL